MTRCTVVISGAAAFVQQSGRHCDIRFLLCWESRGIAAPLRLSWHGAGRMKGQRVVGLREASCLACCRLGRYPHANAYTVGIPLNWACNRSDECFSQVDLRSIACH